MRWIVGVDVGKGSHGALGFAAWLGRAGGSPPVDGAAVHVLEDEHLRAVLRTHHLAEVTDAARAAAQATLERHGVAWPVEVVQAPTALEGLEAAATRRRADALLVGRHAGMDGIGLGRLGRIAREALRALPVSVVVVPHDLTPEDVGGGPVVVLSSLGPDSVEALRFARRLATWTGRKLLVAHVVRSALDRGAAYLAIPPEALQSHRSERMAEGLAGLERWVGRQEVAVDDLRVVEGSVLDAAPRLAREVAAPVLVTGARQLTGLDRRLHTSIGAELAAASPLAVAVVPPGPG